MRTFLSLLLYPSLFAGTGIAAEPSFPKFEVQEISKDLSIGYAVILADLNNDGKPDIVVVDKHRVVWFENPTWKMRTILQGKTLPDNVCVAAVDIDGDGKLGLVLGADWKPFDTTKGGTLQWLRRGKTLDDEWEMFPITEEPMVHRVKIFTPGPDQKPMIVLAPLMGRESTKEANWMNGRPVRLQGFPIPADPVKGPWKPVVLSEELHVIHNVIPYHPHDGMADSALLAASYEGLSLIQQDKAGKWTTTRIGTGNQDNAMSNRGCSEVRWGTFSGRHLAATIEPWHGNQVVVYREPEGKKGGLWERLVLDDHLRWGHGVWVVDLDGDGEPEVIVGVRDNPAKGDTFTEKCGIRIYKATDQTGKKWDRLLVDEGGVACEDLVVGDLDGDGRPDIVAVGRGSKNCRIYWNKAGK